MRRRKDTTLENVVLFLALGLAAFVLYHGYHRWLARPQQADQPPAVSGPTAGMAIAYPLAGAQKSKPQPGVSNSFEAVRSIPPMVLSRTGLPTIRTKAPPPPPTEKK